MSEFTKNGHRLEFSKEPNALFFSCSCQIVVWEQEKSFLQGTTLLARLQIIAPSTKGKMRRTLSAWLSVYDDVELLGQVEGVVDQAFAACPEIPPATPSTVPQKGQGMN